MLCYLQNAQIMFALLWLHYCHAMVRNSGVAPLYLRQTTKDSLANLRHETQQQEILPEFLSEPQGAIYKWPNRRGATHLFWCKNHIVICGGRCKDKVDSAIQRRNMDGDNETVLLLPAFLSHPRIIALAWRQVMSFSLTQSISHHMEDYPDDRDKAPHWRVDLNVKEVYATVWYDPMRVESGIGLSPLPSYV